ncbi:putative protein of unknown function with WD40 repeat domain [Zalerion maritima]|uniref:ASTRA-associated protein 1 n=1 Tax=Zalerion maritima TaxID=339359 RepID=A0AAD5RUM6_9PEZI|nr:putative protein of unknown function with WD40 repeat domain [Zalerion maritima]
MMRYEFCGWETKAMDKTGEESENISEAEQYIGIWKELDTFHLGPQRFVANGPRLISSNRVTASLWRQHSRCEFSTRDQTCCDSWRPKEAPLLLSPLPKGRHQGRGAERNPQATAGTAGSKDWEHGPRQQPEQAQPHPRTILRGHKAQVHAAVFIRNNERLVTGDAEGYVVLWDLAIMRPRAAAKVVPPPPPTFAVRQLLHQFPGLLFAGPANIPKSSHGRDNKLIAWKLSADDESALGVLLPLDLSPTDMKQPWMLHLLEVNTMNFCSFASCPADYRLSIREADELLVAVPNTLATEAVDIFHLPSQQRKQTLKPETGNSQDGMVMALSMFHKTENLTLCVGYENGLAAVVRERIPGSWTTVYVSTPHTQPILSLDAAPDRSYFFTSGADATIAKHPIPDDILNSSNRVVLIKAANTKHAGQQSLRLRDDGRIFATGGWDGMVRVYSARTAKELAVLKWHKTGCYAVAFANVLRGEAESGSGSNTLSKGHIKDSPSSETSKNDGSGAILSTTGSAVASHDHTVVQKLVEVTVKEKRERAAVETHWVAAGGKDGKLAIGAANKAMRNKVAL